MQINVGGRLVTIRELTVRQIRDYIGAEEHKFMETGWSLDPVTDLMLEDMSLRDLTQMTDMSVDDFDDMTSDQLDQIVSACKEKNKNFFTLTGRARQMLERMQRLVSQNSTLGSPE